MDDRFYSSLEAMLYPSRTSHCDNDATNTASLDLKRRYLQMYTDRQKLTEIWHYGLEVISTQN